MFPGHRRYPPQILQDHLVQHAFPDIVGGADFFPLFLVGVTGEVVPGGLHRMRSMQHHGGPTVRAHHQPGVFVLLLHLGGAALVLAHPLDDVPDLPRHQRRVSPLKNQAFLPRMGNPALVLIGFGAVPHVDGVAQIDLILKHGGDSAFRPVAGGLQIHGGMGDPKFLIGVDRRTQKLFTFQLPRDLAGTHTASAHSEDSVDNGGGFLIYHQPVSVILAAPVAIGRSGP